MQHKKSLFRIISLLLLMVFISSTAVFAAEVPESKYTLNVQEVGTIKEKVTLPDYDIKDQDFEVIIVPRGSKITFTPSVTMGATIIGLDEENGVFQNTYDGVPWFIDGEMSLVTEVEGGKTAVGTLGVYPYYIFSISDDNDNITRIFFKMVDEKNTENTGNKTEEKADVPDQWANLAVQEAISLDLVPEKLQNHYKANITRSDFCNLVINMIEIKTGKSSEVLVEEAKKSPNQFTDTTETFILNANALGIVNGKGNGKFDPNGSITRQEAAVMLTNAAKALNQEVPSSANLAYGDSATIAEWAKSSVSFVASKGIMNGTGNNNFSPKGVYSRQQAIVTIVQLFESIK